MCCLRNIAMRDYQETAEFMCRLRNIAMRDYQESVAIGQTDIQTERRRTRWSLCASMLRRRHNNYGILIKLIYIDKHYSISYYLDIYLPVLLLVFNSLCFPFSCFYRYTYHFYSLGTHTRISTLHSVGYRKDFGKMMQWRCLGSWTS